jgi:hypothetical protein
MAVVARACAGGCLPQVHPHGRAGSVHIEEADAARRRGGGVGGDGLDGYRPEDRCRQLASCNLARLPPAPKPQLLIGKSRPWTRPSSVPLVDRAAATASRPSRELRRPGTREGAKRRWKVGERGGWRAFQPVGRG